MVALEEWVASLDPRLRRLVPFVRARCCNAVRVARPDQIDRRGELLAHAERLFRERGYRDTRMVDIAKEAGVAKSLMYWYFESKEALFLAIVHDIRERLRAAQIDAIGSIEDPLQRVYVGTVASVRFVVKNAQLYGLISLAASDPAISEALRDTSTTHAHDTVHELERGQETGIVRSDEAPATLAHANQGVVNHFVTAFLRGQLGPSLSEAAHGAARFVIRGMAATPEVADAVIASVGRSAQPSSQTGALSSK